MSVARDCNGTYSTLLFTEAAVNIINSHVTSEPLFLYVAHQAVHAPLEAPSETIEKFPHIKNKKRRLFACRLISHEKLHISFSYVVVSYHAPLPPK